jgi:hypothetical protein
MNSKICRKRYGVSVEGKGRESRIAKKNGKHVPLLVTVNEPRRNRADVRACTDEQENDEQEGLEVEQRRLRWSTNAWETRQSGLKRKYVEKHRPWCCCCCKRRMGLTRVARVARRVSRYRRGIVNIYLFTSQLWGVIRSTCRSGDGTAFSSDADNLSIKFSRLVPQGRPFIITSLYQLGQLLTSPLEYATTGS